MQSITAVVEEAEIHKISDIFHKKPPGLGFNETDALVIKARMPDGRQIGATFYFHSNRMEHLRKKSWAEMLLKPGDISWRHFSVTTD